jgi:hypothetical protein
VFNQRGGANGLSPSVQGDDSHRYAIGIHTCSDVIEPAVDRPAGIEVSPFVEVPLRDDPCKVGAISKRDDRHVDYTIRRADLPPHCFVAYLFAALAHSTVVVT